MLSARHLITRRAVAALGGLLALLAIAASALLPASASATHLSNRIVPFESIAGVNVRSSFATVEHKLGQPSSRFRYHGKLNTLYYDNAGLIFSITATKRISDYAIEATDSRYRTPNGLHIGDSVKTLKRDYHVVGCTKIGCTIEDSHDIDRSMSVVFKHGKIDGIAIDLTISH